MDIFSEGMESHELVINYKQTKVLYFGGHNSSTFSLKIHLIDMVTQHKYIGIELTKGLTITEDVRRVLSAFDRSEAMLMRKFHSVRKDIKKKLFDSFSLLMYGMNLRLSKKKAAGALKQIATV